MSMVPSLTRRLIAAPLSGLFVLGLLSGCAEPRPIGPRVLALPADGEAYTLFQQHDVSCRQYALAEIDGRSSGQAEGGKIVADAAIGTGVGAAAGAAIGSSAGHVGTGAAVGAGVGLLAGSVVGASEGRKVRQSLQKRYDASYSVCMTANGDHIVTPVVATVAPPRVVYVAPPPVVYAAPPPAVYYAPPPAVYAAPPVAVVTPRP